MKVRIKVPFGGYRVGQIFDWGDGMARVLLARGLVERADAPKVERAVVREVRSEKATETKRVK